MNSEEFLERYRVHFPLRTNHPDWVERQRVKHRLGGSHAADRLTHEVIGGLYGRFVIDAGWTQQDYCLALEECFLAGVSLTRLQVERGLERARSKGLLP